MKSHYITGLDIGTSAIKVLVADKKSDKSNLETIFQIQEPSIGIRRGVIIDPEAVSNTIRSLFLKVREEIGKKIDSVYINVGGSHLFSASSRGVISVSRADRKISEEDIQRVLQAAQTFSLPSNKEIFDVFPKEFVIDGERGIKEPLGLQGIRLEVDVLALGGFSPYLKNLTHSVLGADLQILDMIPSPIAEARAVLTPKQKEIGVAVLNIGAGTSSLAVFEEGQLMHMVILPIGSSNITNDLAIGLKTDIEIAERIKVEYGSCAFSGKDLRIKIEIGEEGPLVISQKFLAKIIEARVFEIFSEISKELKNISREKALPAGIVLTGGGVKLPRIIDLAKREFRLPCKIGSPKGFAELKEDPIFADVCGLVLSGADLEKEEKSGFDFLPDIKIKKNLKKFFRIFIP